jgi:Cu/Ag efflux pump CusA
MDRDRADVPARLVTGLLIRGLPIDILAQIGFVVLVGLAAKNAILIVEFARQAQGDGATVAAAAPGRSVAPRLGGLPQVVPHPLRFVA